MHIADIQPAPGRRRTALALAGALASSLALGGLVTAAAPVAAAGPAPKAATSAATARAGDLLDVRLDQLRPTQPSIGFDQIYYKLGRYTSDKDEQDGKVNKRFDDWCETNGQGEAAEVPAGARLADPSTFTCEIALGDESDDSLAEMKTVVVGPGGALYLTDGHHTLTSFWETPDGGPRTSIRLRVQANYSHLSQADFWAAMGEHDWVWLRDEKGAPITVDQLPTKLGLAQFHDDPYRSLVYFTRDIGYQAPENAAEYLEFLWGGWLRDRVDLAAYDLKDPAAYLAVVRGASELMTGTSADTEIADGRTAAELGRMDEWNDGKKPTGGEFGKLSAPLADEKPGKLAYALDFRARVAPSPACTTTLTGTHNGPLVVSGKVTCLDRTHVTGPVVVRAGASLVANGAEIDGPVQAVGADTVHLCGVTVRGPLSVIGTRERLTLDGPGCTANTIAGPVQLAGNPRS